MDDRKIVGSIEPTPKAAWINSDEGLEWKRKQDQAAGCFGFALLLAGIITGGIITAIIYGFAR